MKNGNNGVSGPRRPIIPYEPGPKDPVVYTPPLTVIWTHDDIIRALDSIAAMIYEPVWILLPEDAKAALYKSVETWSKLEEKDIATKSTVVLLLLLESKSGDL